MSDPLISPELLTIYIEDAREHLDALESCLLKLERNGVVPDAFAAVLGPLHTLKGNSGMMGFSSIKDYIHSLEDVCSQAGSGQIALDAAGIDRLLTGASALRDAVEQAGHSGAEGRDLTPELALLHGLLRSSRTRALPKPDAKRPPERTVVSGGDDPEASSRYVAARSNMVRVEFGQLDHLLNLVGELIIHRTKLHELAKEFAEREGREKGRELLEAAQQVTGVSTQLQETVMDIRMLPIRHVFERFPRMVRDLARAQGKEIDLIVEGEGTRVDKAIIDEIGEPLVHLIRNSVDHGIETPDVRTAAGKTGTGTILLSATQESNQVVVTLMDDGRGIDIPQVRKRAVSMGYIRDEQQIPERDAVQLIFAPGFSTRESVTDVSGRGVGLDVVLKSIEALNGLIEVETVSGVGTKFIIQLPLTLAIISVLLVEAGSETYALPLSSVVENLRLRADAIHRINGKDTIRLRDRVVPLLRLSEIFSLGVDGSREAHYAVILGRGEKRVGLMVDRLRGQQEVVIKALDQTVTKAAFGLAGATIMGDGRVVLILDVAALFEGQTYSVASGRGVAVMKS